MITSGVITQIISGGKISKATEDDRTEQMFCIMNRSEKVRLSLNANRATEITFSRTLERYHGIFL